MQKGTLLCLACLWVSVGVQAKSVGLTEDELRAQSAQAGLTVDFQDNQTNDQVEWQDTGAAFLVGGSASGASPDESSASTSIGFNSNSMDTSQFSQNMGSFQHSENNTLSTFNGDFSFDQQVSGQQQGFQPATQFNTGSYVPQQQQLNTDQFGMYAATGAAIFMAEFNMNVYSLGKAVIDAHQQSATVDAFFTATSSSLENVTQTVNRNLYIHDHRGQFQPQGENEGLAHLNLTFAPTTNENGDTALKMDIHSFTADIDMTQMQIGNGNAIGDLYITDIAGTSSLVVFAH